jgi:hypothetical protein
LHFVHRTSLVVLAVLTVCAVPASADPITAIYDVQVFERQILFGPLEHFSQQFELRMSFDPDVRSEHTACGPVSFSSVPLTVTEPPADLLPLGSVGRTHQVVDFATGPAVVADATEFILNREQNEQTQREYVLTIQLSAILADPPVTLTAENFPAHLPDDASR